MRMSLLRGVQGLALGGACLAALRFLSSSSSSGYPTAAGRTTGPPDAVGSSPPRLRSRRFRSPTGWGKTPLPNAVCGGIVDMPGREMNPDDIELARFAVAEHNSKANAALEFVRLVKVRRQVVAGTMNYFTIEAREVGDGDGDGDGTDDDNKLYEAKVWLRPWENFKGLHAFEPVANTEL